MVHAIDMRMRIDSSLATGMKDSSKSTPSTWAYPWATNRDLFRIISPSSSVLFLWNFLVKQPCHLLNYPIFLLNYPILLRSPRSQKFLFNPVLFAKGIKFLCGLATRACDWINLRLSHQNRTTLFFLKILTFLHPKKKKKTKYFPKTTKTLKIFLCLINQDWACENTFKQVQSHKWIWHSLNIDLCEVCGYKKWDSP